MILLRSYRDSSPYQESVRNDQIFYRSILCVHNITHKFRLSIYTTVYILAQWNHYIKYVIKNILMYAQ